MDLFIEDVYEINIDILKSTEMFECSAFKNRSTKRYSQLQSQSQTQLQSQ